ncbi:MAG TPA: OsmC family protein [Fimbriimonas sp.]|nr:OsmC family protein [Fimbriimonas sp.]
MLTVNWKGRMAFEAAVPSGNNFTMDATGEAGGDDLGPTPLEAFIASAGACSAMDVISILEKKRQKVTSYRIEVEWKRAPQGSPWPRPIEALVVRHIVTGHDLESEAVGKAVELSEQKYCSVMATLRYGPAISSEYRIEAALDDPAAE